MKLYGREWTRREIEARLGRLEQIGGLRRLTGSEGPEAGVEQVQVRTGAGLAYTVLPSRGMDIGMAEFGGAALAWLSPNGEAHPSYHDPHGLGWLRTAAGGLLMTCGLTQVGSPGEDQGEALGLHGRAHHTPARQVGAKGRWEGDEYLMEVSGQIEEVSLFGPHLRLSRTVTSRLGQNRLDIADTVENLGFEPAPHMLLYHFNFGFPLLSEATRLSLPHAQVRGREAGLPLDGLDAWQGPTAGFKERVYYHENMEIDDNGYAKVEISNPAFPSPTAPTPLTVRLGWDTRTLPLFIQWQMPGQDAHVLGLEPANCHVEGRAAERARGTLVMLEPGEKREYGLWVEVLGN